MTGREWIVRIGLAGLAVSAVVIGAWALAAPRAFYDDFPGFGRVWVAVDGPFNEHLVRDVGGLNLALAAVLIAAAWTLSRPLVLTALAASLLFGVPHFAYHVAHVDKLQEAADQVGELVSLGLGVAVPLALLPLAARLRPGSARVP